MPKQTAKPPSAVVATASAASPAPAAKPARARARPRSVAPPDPPPEVAAAGTAKGGRTEPLSAAEADRFFREAVALFNGVRYWFAHEAWETLWRAAEDEERDFYQGLIQVAAGLLHLQRRNARGARNKLREGIARLQRYQPVHRGVLLDELVGISMRYLEELDAGSIPYLIPPVIRWVEVDTFDPSR